MNKRMVIFIGGSSYSGSTFIDMMLGSGKECLSLGEVHALYHPKSYKHLSPICGCGKRDCKIWSGMDEISPKYLYHNLFLRIPYISCIIDSSKDPLWINWQEKQLKRQGIDVKHVLIWKDPLEFAMSKFKRGAIHEWEKNWKNYYKLYFSCINTWTSINYKMIACNPGTMLRSLCDRIGIKYFDGKEFFWKYLHHTIFGNNSAKIHLYNPETKQFKMCSNRIKAKNKFNSKEKHQKIYYKPVDTKLLPSNVASIIKSDKELKSIQKLLLFTGISDNYDKKAINQLKSELAYSFITLLLRRANKNYKLIFNSLKYVGIQKSIRKLVSI